MPRIVERLRQPLLAGLLGICACAKEPPRPRLTSIAPTVFDEQVGGSALIEGEAILPAVTFDFDRPSASKVSTQLGAYISNTERKIDLTHVTWIDTRHVSVAVAPQTPRGIYDLHVVDGRQVDAVLIQALEVAPCTSQQCLLGDGGIWTPDGEPMPCAELTFEDLDGDHFGRNDTPAKLCGPGRAAVAGDCNDLDSLTHPGAIEICNQVDDNCDSHIDNGACSASTWKAVSIAGAESEDWSTVSTWSPGNVWIAGDAKLYVRRRATGRFDNASADCPRNIAALWTDKQSGDVYVAGGNPGIGRFAMAHLGDGACSAEVRLSEPAASVSGEHSADGGIAVWAILRNGNVATRTTDINVLERASNLPKDLRLNDAHATSWTVQVAVGDDRSTTPRKMKAFVFNAADGGFDDQHVDRLTALPSGSLNGVWANSITNIVAVGDEGVVLEKTPAGWRRLPSPENAALTSVRAFGSGRVYVVTDSGNVHFWNGNRWSVIASDPQRRAFTKIDGSSEDDLWVVGHGGVILHWPEPL